jgi:hypothetical protein
VVGLILCGAVLLVPLLLLKSGAVAAQAPASAPRAHQLSADPGATGPAHLADHVARATTGTRAHATPVAAPTTTTSVPPTTTTTGPVETTLPSQDVASHATLAPVAGPTTTTTAPPPATTTTTAPPAAATLTGGDHYGQVTYYEHPAGTCASPFLPFGTVVTITNPANGESVRCLVNDREADTARSIDLATSTFAEIAPLSQGVINAELSW